MNEGGDGEDREETVRAGDLADSEDPGPTYAETPEFVERELEERYPVGAIVHHFETFALHVVIWHLPSRMVDEEAHDVPPWSPAVETVRVADAADAGLPVTEASVADLRASDDLEPTTYPVPGPLFQMEGDARVPHYREGGR